MKPGRELDALIAERVMDWTQKEMWGINDYREDGSPVLMPNFPNYSDNIEAAWEVVEKLKSEGHDFVIASHQQDGFKNWYVKINAKPELYYISQGDHESAAHAICLCALRAYEVKI